jgi:hypothetical protein
VSAFKRQHRRYRNDCFFFRVRGGSALVRFPELAPSELSYRPPHMTRRFTPSPSSAISFARTTFRRSMRLLSIRPSALHLQERDETMSREQTPSRRPLLQHVPFGIPMAGRGYGLRCEQITRSEWQQGVSVTSSTRRGHCQPGVIPLGPRNYDPVWLCLRPPGRIKK